MKVLKALLLAAAGLVAGLWAASYLPALRDHGGAGSTESAERGTVASPDAAEAYRCGDCNLLLISIDTLRADRLGAYGYRRENTPHLAELARQSVLFERFYHNGGGTLPSHMTMLTSLSPITHRVDVNTGMVLDPRWVTLAEQLQGAGFATAAFVDGGWMSSKFGFAQGFDAWDESGGGFTTILPKAHAWVTAHRDERFFLLLHTYDVHSTPSGYPYRCPGDYAHRFGTPPATFDGCRGGRCASELLTWTNAGIVEETHTLDDVFTAEEVAGMSTAYDGCIGYVDKRIADFLGVLRELDLYDETLVAVTSDHGEEFGEHGMLLHDRGGYDEVSRIPLILKLPHSRLAGRKVQGLAAMVDLEPTLLDILDVPVPTQVQGYNLMPAILDGQETRREVHMYTNLVTETWKMRSETGELYRYRHDPGEKIDLRGQDPALEHRLLRRLEELVAEDKRARLDGRSAAPNLSDEEAARLRALGYLR